jgi:hypothetical protein
MAYGELGREEILARGGIRATLNVLWKNQLHAELAELSLNLFFDLSFSGATEELTKDNATVLFCLSMLTLHRSSLPTLKECTRTLSRLYVNSGEATRLLMVKEGFVEKLVSLYSEHNENKHFRRQIESTLCRISREKFPDYEEVHTADKRVPSLLELAGRTVIDKQVPHQEIEDTFLEESSSSSFLPEDLSSMLSLNHRCLLCSRSYLRHSRSTVCPTLLPASLCLSRVPIFVSVCSESCLEEVKAVSLKTQVSHFPNPHDVRVFVRKEKIEDKMETLDYVLL